MSLKLYRFPRKCFWILGNRAHLLMRAVYSVDFRQCKSHAGLGEKQDTFPFKTYIFLFQRIWRWLFPPLAILARNDYMCLVLSQSICEWDQTHGHFESTLPFISFYFYFIFFFAWYCVVYFNPLNFVHFPSLTFSRSCFSPSLFLSLSH